MTINLKFDELRCAKCGAEMEQGMIQMSDDTQMVKRCSSSICDFWMIIIIPNDEYDYSIQKTLKE